MRSLLRAGAVLTAALIAGLLVPGLLYWQCHVFTDEQVAEKLPPTPRAIWTNHQNRLTTLVKDLSLIEARVDHEINADGSTVGQLLDERDRIAGLINRERAAQSIKVSGYFLDSLMYVPPTFLAGIGLLLFVLGPSGRPRFRGASEAALFLGTYFVYRFPTWLRNLPQLRRVPRDSYAYGNWDVSPSSFFIAEGVALLICLLLVALWLSWLDFFSRWRSMCSPLVNRTSVPLFGKAYASLFLYWQICSVVLAGAFIPYTIYFWDVVIDQGQRRYLLQAVIMHGFWGASWILLSLPLAWTWYTAQAELAGLAMRPCPSETPDESSDPSSDIFPLGRWNIIGSVVASVLGFAFPLIKQLFKG
jgi:hypothetical protein